MRLIAFVPLAALLALIAISIFLLTREGARNHFTEGMVGQTMPAYSLARLEGEVAFERLLARYPRLTWADDAPQWRPLINLRGLERLTLRAACPSTSSG